MALAVQKLCECKLLTVVCSNNGVNGLVKIFKEITVYQIGFTAQTVTKLKNKSLKFQHKLGGRAEDDIHKHQNTFKFF